MYILFSQGLTFGHLCISTCVKEMSKHLSQVKTENRIWEHVLKAFLGMDWNLWLSWELPFGTFEDDFLFPKWDMLIPCKYIYIYIWIRCMYSMHIYIHILVILSRSHLIIMNLYFSFLSSLGWENDSICSEVFWLATCWCLSRRNHLDVNCFQMIKWWKASKQTRTRWKDVAVMKIII